MKKENTIEALQKVLDEGTIGKDFIIIGKKNGEGEQKTFLFFPKEREAFAQIDFISAILFKMNEEIKSRVYDFTFQGEEAHFLSTRDAYSQAGETEEAFEEMFDQNIAHIEKMREKEKEEEASKE